MSKNAIIFAGQGSQKVGMGKELVKKSRAAKDIFQRADEITDGQISKLCFEGPQEELNLTINTQPCVFTMGVAHMAALIEKGIEADVALGFSLGEYGALVLSGVLSFEDAFKLVIIRGTLMNEAATLNNGSMAAIIGIDNVDLNKLCDEIEGYIEPVNYNCPGQTVVAGDAKAIDKICTYIKDNNLGRAIPLAVSGAFHSKHMKNAADKYEEAIKDITFDNPKIPFISNVTGDFVTSGETLKKYAVKQIYSPVLWEKSIRNAIAYGIDNFIEAGPGRTLTGFMKKIDADKKACLAENLLN